MKKVVNKTVLTVILALSMLVALFCGLFSIGQKNVADAAGKAISVNVTAVERKTDTPLTSFTQGTKYDLKVTVTMNLPNSYFHSITLKIVALTDDLSAVDATKTGYLGLRTYLSDTNVKANLGGEDLEISDTSTFEEGATISIARTSGSLSCDEVLDFRVRGEIKADVPDATKFKIGVVLDDSSNLTHVVGGYNSTAQWIYFNDTSKVECTPLNFEVKQPSSVNTLEGLKVGQGDTEGALTDLDLTNPTITITDITKPISIYPTLTDDTAKIALKKTGETGDGTAAANKTITKFDIPDDGKITIEVTAENGDVKTYTLEVKIVAAKLTALTAEPDSATTGATKGLKENFDSKTLAYTVTVPSDSTKVTITATVSTGNGASDDIYLTKSGSCIAPASAKSATAFDVTGVKNNDTLTIKLSADDGQGNTSSLDYVITFKVVDVTTEITLSVVGTSKGKTFANDEAKATAAGVDYYYVVAGETNASSTVTVKAPSTAAEVKLDGVNYTAAKTLTDDKTHTVTVKAEAGNTKEYKFILKSYKAIKLKSGIKADFIFLHTENGKEYRKSYAKEGKVHGVDDLSFSRFVIGNIEDYTSVNKFLTNFDVATSTIRLYKADGTLVYDCGTAKNDYTTADLDKADKAVATGWKLEYVVDGKVEETIYLSVLGDLNCDGFANAMDVSAISGIILKDAGDLAKLDTLEIKLASLIANQGNLPQAGDIGILSQHIQGETPLSVSF